jgi:integrase/recombinase XerD
MPATDAVQPRNPSTLGPQFDEFLKQGRFLRNWSPRTVRSDEQAFASFAASGSAVSAMPTRSALESWVVWMREKGLSPGACNAYIRAMNSFLTWAHAEELIPAPLHLKTLRSEKRVIEIFDSVHVRTLVSFQPKGFSETRLHVLILTLLDTGCCIEEALTAADGSVDLENLLLTVMGKGSKERKIPFSLELRKSLFRFQQLKAKQDVPRGMLFCTRSGTRLSYRNVYRDIRAHCEALGIEGPRISPHTMRHTFATAYLKQGGDIYKLCRILGHTDIRTTMIYLHLSHEDLRQQTSLLRRSS